jgi:CRP-like cAMP-binding protein
MASSPQSQNLLLAALPPDDFEFLRSNLQTIDMPVGLVLIRSGDVPKRAYFPQGGVIASCVTLSDGRAVEARIVGREGALGATIGAGERISFTSAVVRLAGKASTIDYRTLETAIDRSSVFRALLARHDALQLAMADQSVACNAAHDAEERLARRLLRLRSLSDDNRITATQEVLAEMLGIQRNAVSQVAHAMQAANLIRFSRGVLEIVDFDGMRQQSCECYDTIGAYRAVLGLD